MTKQHPDIPASSPAAPAKVPGERLILLILAVIQFSHIIDFMIIMPLGATFMRTFDISPRQFSLIVSAYAISAFLSGMLGATVIDRFDRKTALLSCYAGFTLGTFACSLAPDYYFFLAARSLTGAFGGLLSALILAVIGDIIPLQRRGRAMGTVMTAFSIASVAGVPLGIYLAATFNWRAPFLFIGALAGFFTVLSYFVLPSMKAHLSSGLVQRNPLRVMSNIARDNNQMSALLFTIVLMLGHFSIIPFIAPYMQRNIGFSDYEVTYIYAIGGLLTVFLLPYFGRLADRFGHHRVFSFASVAALFSILAITHLPSVSIALALVATSSFFVVASGRNVPATTLITSVVRPENRASFLSVRTSVREMGLAIASAVAGFIITEGPDGHLEHYPYVGYFAIAMSVLAIAVAYRLRPVN